MPEEAADSGGDNPPFVGHSTSKWSLRRRRRRRRRGSGRRMERSGLFDLQWREPSGRRPTQFGHPSSCFIQSCFIVAVAETAIVWPIKVVVECDEADAETRRQQQPTTANNNSNHRTCNQKKVQHKTVGKTVPTQQKTATHQTFPAPKTLQLQLYSLNSTCISTCVSLFIFQKFENHLQSAHCWLKWPLQSQSFNSMASILPETRRFDLNRCSS